MAGDVGSYLVVELVSNTWSTETGESATMGGIEAEGLLVDIVIVTKLKG